MMPLVSVIIPCYNHEPYVAACIRSVLDQTYQPIELIVIDDGSRDGSVAQIQALAAACRQRFVRSVFIYRENRGLTATLNQAIGLSQGSYLAIMASDDVMYPDKTAQQIAYFQSDAQAVALFGDVDVIDEHGQVIGALTAQKPEYGFEEIICNVHCCLAPTQMYRADFIRQLGGYDESVKVEDWELLLRISQQGGKIVNLQRKLCQYRQHGSNFSNKHWIMYQEKKNILQKYRHSQFFYQGSLLNRMSLYQAEWMEYQKLRSSNYLLYKFLKIKIKFKISWLAMCLQLNRSFKR